MYRLFFKRLLDILLSAVALILLSPVMIILAILIYTKLGSPVLFKQDRPGKNERIFKLYKFRSMTNEREENGELLSDEIRLTPFGKALRSTSLDELPELINILKGDMSIIGPRPLLVAYLPYYNERERQRHLVRPGLSGLAQINGRNTSSWEQTFDYDVEYVNNISFLMDAKIVCATFYKVFKRSDIVQGSDNIMGRFDDYRKNTQE